MQTFQEIGKKNFSLVLIIRIREFKIYGILENGSFLVKLMGDTQKVYCDVVIWRIFFGILSLSNSFFFDNFLEIHTSLKAIIIELVLELKAIDI